MMSEMEAKEMTEPETVNVIDLMDGNLSDMVKDYTFPEGMTVDKIIEAGKALKYAGSLESILRKGRMSRMIEAIGAFDKPPEDKRYDIGSYDLHRAINATGEPEGGMLHIAKERVELTNRDLTPLIEAYEGAMFTCPKCGHRGARTYPTKYGSRHCKKCKDTNSFHSWVYDQFNGYNYRFRDYDAENAYKEWRSSLKFQIQTIVDDVPSDKSVEMGFENASASVELELKDAREVFNKDCDSNKRFVVLVWRSDMPDPVCKIYVDRGRCYGHWEGNLTADRKAPEPVEYTAFKSGYAVPL